MKTELHICRDFKLATPIPTTIEEIRTLAPSNKVAAKLIDEMVRRQATFILKRGWSTKFQARCVTKIAEIRKDNLTELRKEDGHKDAEYLSKWKDVIATVNDDGETWALKEDYAELSDHPLEYAARKKAVKSVITDAVKAMVEQLVAAGLEAQAREILTKQGADEAEIDALFVEFAQAKAPEEKETHLDFTPE